MSCKHERAKLTRIIRLGWLCQCGTEIRDRNEDRPMTNIASLLDPEQAEALRLARSLYLGAGKTDGDVTWDRVTLDEPEVQVTSINGVEFDMRSGAMVDTTCADCPERLRVEVAPEPSEQWLMAGRTRQEFHDRLCSTPRVAVCMPCGKKRTTGKSGVVVHVNPKEQPMPEITLTGYTDTEVAAMAVQARARMVAAAEAEIPEKQAKSKKAEKERVAKDEKQKVADRKTRKAMPGFLVKGKEVPALDLSDLSNVQELVSPKVRSPYNKALHAVGQTRLDAETTTWLVLAETHAYLLMNHADDKAKPVKTKTKKVKAVKEGKKAKKKERELMAAVVDPGTKAKIEAYANVTGKTLVEAERHLTMVGVL